MNLEKYCGIEKPLIQFKTFLTYFSIILGLISFVFSKNLLLGLFILISLPIIVQSMFYLSLYAISIVRAKKAEKHLPDLLFTLSTNLKAGLPMSEALLLSVRSEYGALAKEMKKLLKESITSASFPNLMKDVGDKFNSKIIKRTFNLIAEGIKKGGNVSTLLFNIASDLKQFQLLEKEKKAEINAQVMFILISVIFAIPFLLGGAFSFISQTLKLSEIYSINVNFIFYFSLAILLVNALFSSIIIGVIKENKKIAALKYFPFIYLISNFVFSIVIYIFKSVLIF